MCHFMKMTLPEPRIHHVSFAFYAPAQFVHFGRWFAPMADNVQYLVILTFKTNNDFSISVEVLQTVAE